MVEQVEPEKFGIFTHFFFTVYVKSKIKWGNCYELFSIFIIENELFIENVKKWGTAVTNRTVEWFNLHS